MVENFKEFPPFVNFAELLFKQLNEKVWVRKCELYMFIFFKKKHILAIFFCPENTVCFNCTSDEILSWEQSDLGLYSFAAIQ